MEQNRKSENRPSPESRRSFNRFLAIVIIIMLLTGFLALWDNWGGDVIEQTGPDETKKLALPNEVTVTLLPESQLSFQKGSAHKIVLKGQADIRVGHGPITREISFETKDVTAKTKEGNYHLQANAMGTKISVNAGQVHLILKPETAGAFFLEEGESYEYKKEEGDKIQ